MAPSNAELNAAEQARALEYRRMMQARENNRAERERQLVGNPVRLLALRIGVAPLLGWEGWDPDIKVKDEPK